WHCRADRFGRSNQPSAARPEKVDRTWMTRHVMLRTVMADEIKKIAQTIRQFAAGCDWSGDAFDLRKCAVLSVISQLAYCAIGADERERRNRAKLVPCENLRAR